MTSIVVGGRPQDGGTPIGQFALFPGWYPKEFTLRGQKFVRSGAVTDPDLVDLELQQFKKLNRKHSVPQISQLDISGFMIVNAAGIAPGRTVLVGGAGCVYRSPDFGRTWTKVTISALGSTQIYGLAGNGAGVWVGLVGGALWRSTDDGLNWAVVSGVTALNNISARVTYLGNSTFIVPDDSGNAILRSNDNGAGWSGRTMPTGYSNANYLCTSANFSGNVIIQCRHTALTDIVYYRSFDYGANWQAASWFDGSPATVRVAALQDEPITPTHIQWGENNRVVAIRRKRHTEDVPNVWRAQIYTSTDNGLTFQRSTVLESGNIANFGIAVGPGAIESLCYIGDDKWVLRHSANETNGSMRDPTRTAVLTFSAAVVEPLLSDQSVVGAGQINQGTDARYPHQAVELYDPTTGDSVLTIIASSGNGNTYFASYAEEVIGSQNAINAYVGSGAGYQASLVYYQRVA